MAKIHTLKIKNYKSIQNFEQIFRRNDFVCIIGRGDSGKTSILEAISIVLSPNWNLTFYDTDFYNCDITCPIEIETSLYDLPTTLTKENKYGLFIRGLDPDTNIIHDEVKDNHEAVLTIKLVVTNSLEPTWWIVNDRAGQESIEIKSNDRASLNVFLVSDYIDRHFSWNKGNPLYSLLIQEDSHDKKTSFLLDAFRDAKKKIDSTQFEHLNKVIKRVQGAASNLGMDISNTTTTVDFKDIFLKDGKTSLHENNVPFRQKGKGSKRLISIAIQTELVKSGGILLIDEIEQGLEPDRAQHLAQTLKNAKNGQVFITTHSRDVLVELQAEDIYRMKQKSKQLNSFNNALQGCIRSNPEAFFSDRVLVCEGSTEIGICRALNNFRISNTKPNAAFLGIRFANGFGSQLIEYTTSFLKAGYDVCLLCDSDVEAINERKTELINSGIKIIDPENGKSIEKQLFDDLPWIAILELINYKIQERDEESIKQSVASKFGPNFPANWKEADTIAMRNALYKASVIKDKEWFKRIDHGYFVGSVCCKYLSEMKETKLKSLFNNLSYWIDNA